MGYSEDQLIEIRRHLHRNPELSGDEYETAEFIEKKLSQMGIREFKRVGNTGVVAMVRGKKPGPVLGWRADIDALPITEKNETAYCSRNEGIMHACGHDVHTTIGLGIAKYLSERTDQLAGAVKMIFQPAEEADPGDDETVGAEKMVELGVLDNPDLDALFAIHCMPKLDVGKIGFTQGPVWANSNAFDIEIHGTSAHGAYPHEGVDAIQLASKLTIALQEIPSRKLDARESAVVSVGILEGGDSFNVLADETRLRGIFRSFSDDVSNQIEEQIRQLTDRISEANGATADIDISHGARAVLNNAEITKQAVDQLRKLDSSSVVRHEPQLGAEDFSSFSRRIPSSYLFLGIRGNGVGKEGLHSAMFDVDEECLQFGVEQLSQMLLGLASDSSELL